MLASSLWWLRLRDSQLMGNSHLWEADASTVHALVWFLPCTRYRQHAWWLPDLRDQPISPSQEAESTRTEADHFPVRFHLASKRGNVLGRVSILCYGLSGGYELLFISPCGCQRLLGATPSPESAELSPLPAPLLIRLRWLPI